MPFFAGTRRTGIFTSSLPPPHHLKPTDPPISAAAPPSRRSPRPSSSSASPSPSSSFSSSSSASASSLLPPPPPPSPASPAAPTSAAASFDGITISSSSLVDITTKDLYDRIQFLDVDGGPWKQGWVVTYAGDEWDREKLKVFVVPHSHNDLGWKLTVDEYYDRQSRFILDTIVESPSKDFRSGQQIGTRRRVDDLYQLEQLHLPSSSLGSVIPLQHFVIVGRKEEVYMGRDVVFGEMVEGFIKYAAGKVCEAG